MKRFKLFPVVFLLLDACIEPLKVDVIKAPPQLVVEGLITNERGPYQVSLFYSTQLNNTVRRPYPESGASVWILCDDGESEELVETVPGTYQTRISGMQGQIGKAYKLQIITRSEKRYETTYQKLNAPGNLDSLYLSFDPKGIADNDGAVLKDGIKLLVNAAGISDRSVHYRWRWTTVHKVKSFPELATENTPHGPVPAPEPCSGYIPNGLTISKVGECTCCICWSTRFGSNAIVSESSGNDYYAAVTIGELEVNSMLFYDLLYVEADQLSLSDEAYHFWKKVELQQKSAGNLFQPNSIKIQGNIVSLSDPNEEVLGIFTASGIRRKSFFFDKSIVPYVLPPIDTIPHDCQDSFLNATTEKPSFW